MKILGFDPGDKYIGWGVLQDGEPARAGVIKDWQKLPDLFAREVPDIVVCEAFVLYRRKALVQSGSSMQTPQVIGMLRMLAAHHEIPFHLQQASRIRHDPLVRTLKFHKSNHANDALKHAKAFYLKQYTDAYTAPKERQNAS